MEFRSCEDYNAAGLHRGGSTRKSSAPGLGKFMQGLLIVFIVLLAVVFLAAAMRSFKIFNRLQTALSQAGLKVTVFPFVTISMFAGLFAGLTVLLFSGSPAPPLMTAAIITAAPSFFALGKRRRRFRAFRSQLPDAMELMIRSL